MVIRCDSARNMGTVSFFEKYVYNQLDEWDESHIYNICIYLIYIYIRMYGMHSQIVWDISRYSGRNNHITTFFGWCLFCFKPWWKKNHQSEQQKWGYEAVSGSYVYIYIMIYYVHCTFIDLKLCIGRNTFHSRHDHENSIGSSWISPPAMLGCRRVPSGKLT
jgi:hypothetical protein